MTVPLEKCDYAVAAFSAFFLRSLRFPYFLITSAFYVFLATIFAIFIMFLSCNKSYFPHLFHYCKNNRNKYKTGIFMPVFIQLKVHKNAAYFATSPAYFGYVCVAFFSFWQHFSRGQVCMYTHTRTAISRYVIKQVLKRFGVFIIDN